MSNCVIKYVNHLGTEIELAPPNFHVQSGDEFGTWRLSRTALNGKTVGFSKSAIDRSFSFAIVAQGDNGLALRDALFDIACLDTEASMPGKLYIDGWYAKGYISESTISKHQYEDNVAMYKLLFSSDTPLWTKEHFTTYYGATEAIWLDYPYDYPHDYGQPSGRGLINNPDIVSSEFKLEIQGFCSNPSIVIGSNTYRVDVVLQERELLIIDSMNDGVRKTITKKDVYGNETNVFSLRHGDQKRGSGTYVFEKIPPGVSNVEWNGEFNFQITTYEQRLQRRWS